MKRIDKINIAKIVDIAFRKITEIGFFDEEKGNEPIGPIYNKPMSIIPGAMTRYVNDSGYGCCFVFSAYMMNILNKYNINNYMIATREGNGTRASVMYEDNGKFYVANPVEDIEYFTNHNITPNNRAKYYDGNTSTMIIDEKPHNDSRYTLDEFSKKYGDIWLIGSMSKNANKTLETNMKAMGNKQIMPPESANYDVKQLLLNQTKIHE